MRRAWLYGASSVSPHFLFFSGKTASTRRQDMTKSFSIMLKFILRERIDS